MKLLALLYTEIQMWQLLTFTIIIVKGIIKKCHRTILTMAFYNLYFNYITNYFFNKISYMMHHICCLQDKLVLKKLLLHDSLFSTQFCYFLKIVII